MTCNNTEVISHLSNHFKETAMPLHEALISVWTLGLLEMCVAISSALCCGDGSTINHLTCFLLKSH